MGTQCTSGEGRRQARAPPASAPARAAEAPSAQLGPRLSTSASQFSRLKKAASGSVSSRGCGEDYTTRCTTGTGWSRRPRASVDYSEPFTERLLRRVLRRARRQCRPASAARRPRAGRREGSPELAILGTAAPASRSRRSPAKTRAGARGRAAPREERGAGLGVPGSQPL